MLALPLTLPKISKMIHKKLEDVKMEIEEKIESERRSLVAMNYLIKLIDQVDHEVELIPYEDKQRLAMLLESLKGKELTHEEVKLVQKIAIA